MLDQHQDFVPSPVVLPQYRLFCTYKQQQTKNEKKD